MKKTCLRFFRLWIPLSLLVGLVHAHTPTNSINCNDEKNGCSPNISHQDTDATIPLTAKQEQQLVDYIEKNGIGRAPVAKQSLQALVAPRYDEVGQWIAPMSWPIVPIHVSLLNDGRVLAYDSSSEIAAENTIDHTMTRAAIWDPVARTITSVNAQTGYNLFCSGLSKLPDGRLFIAGGNKNNLLQGIDKTHIFDPISNLWSMESTMSAPRWYPSVTPLSNGEMLITGGEPALSEVREINGILRPLTGAVRSVWANRIYPWLHVAPNGKALYYGPLNQLGYVTTNGVGAWQSLGTRDGQLRSYGSSAMYDIGKILVSGGGKNNNTAIVIDVNKFLPTVTPISPMIHARMQHNLTVLADGSVLATGGNSAGGLANLTSSVFPTELWHPDTGQWTQLASIKYTRQYHSFAVLLPDAKVMIGGGGICGVCEPQGYHFKNTETFLPPYLFKKDGSNLRAPRPYILTTPKSITYAQIFTATTNASSSIKKIALVRPGSVTHSINMEQRYIPLVFSQIGNTLQITAPANANIAPPGSYMLFIINNSGTPSVSKMVNIQ